MKKFKVKVMAILLFAILALLVFTGLFTIIKWLGIAAITAVIGVVFYTLIESIFLKAKPKK